MVIWWSERVVSNAPTRWKDNEISDCNPGFVALTSQDGKDRRILQQNITNYQQRGQISRSQIRPRNLKYEACRRLLRLLIH